jgi:hypothetical protein
VGTVRRVDPAVHPDAVPAVVPDRDHHRQPRAAEGDGPHPVLAAGAGQRRHEVHPHEQLRLVRLDREGEADPLGERGRYRVGGLEQLAHRRQHGVGLGGG